MHGKHMQKTYSRTRSTIALSSAEAEFYATVQEASEGLGMAAMALDFGKVMVPWMYVDASAAIGIAQRKGSVRSGTCIPSCYGCRMPFERRGFSSTRSRGRTPNILMPRRY